MGKAAFKANQSEEFGPNSTLLQLHRGQYCYTKDGFVFQTFTKGMLLRLVK